LLKKFGFLAFQNSEIFACGKKTEEICLKFKKDAEEFGHEMFGLKWISSL